MSDAKKIATLRRMTKDAGVIAKVIECLVMQARSEVITETVEKYVKPIFESFEFFETEEHAESRDRQPQRITDIEKLYLTDLDSEQYQEFGNQCHEAHLAGPFASVIAEKPEPGYCPALVAQDEHRICKRELATHVAVEWLGLERINYPHSDRMAHLVTGAVLNGPCKREALAAIKQFSTPADQKRARAIAKGI